jgi:hypothetical protein
MTVIADAYQAATAVKFAIANMKNVMVKRTNTINIGRLRVVAAIVIYAVKMPQASKNFPKVAGNAAGGIFPA